ncbi:hypothetical protein PTSG_00261 [Salpingoeca rosetta]|uniref:HECT domain-containing protein n=1 Tax=Salpingoeca rosetta (strain ATCC 50818 / BSB-021) TaxID=946362 RepID=F2TVZ4_SALR5|nr:uncharacterized protein PTSG_00261 [Salpingoeca rosetta]EGD72240.1 hypothetical protein PTSG_00261 [Salpingoeca rosetta]|eukprot:XP_004998811.1 hypothetical protein PTSG_00261 [Salpingoeca rosetta]
MRMQPEGTGNRHQYHHHHHNAHQQCHGSSNSIVLLADCQHMLVYDGPPLARETLERAIVFLWDWHVASFAPRKSEQLHVLGGCIMKSTTPAPVTQELAIYTGSVGAVHDDLRPYCIVRIHSVSSTSRLSSSSSSYSSSQEARVSWRTDTGIVKHALVPLQHLWPYTSVYRRPKRRPLSYDAVIALLQHCTIAQCEDHVRLLLAGAAVVGERSVAHRVVRCGHALDATPLPISVAASAPRDSHLLVVDRGHPMLYHEDSGALIAQDGSVLEEGRPGRLVPLRGWPIPAAFIRVPLALSSGSSIDVCGGTTAVIRELTRIHGWCVVDAPDLSTVLDGLCSETTRKHTTRGHSGSGHDSASGGTSELVVEDTADADAGANSSSSSGNQRKPSAFERLMANGDIGGAARVMRTAAVVQCIARALFTAVVEGLDTIVPATKHDIQTAAAAAARSTARRSEEDSSLDSGQTAAPPSHTPSSPCTSPYSPSPSTSTPPSSSTSLTRSTSPASGEAWLPPVLLKLHHRARHHVVVLMPQPWPRAAYRARTLALPIDGAPIHQHVLTRVQALRPFSLKQLRRLRRRLATLCESPVHTHAEAAPLPPEVQMLLARTGLSAASMQHANDDASDSDDDGDDDDDGGDDDHNDDEEQECAENVDDGSGGGGGGGGGGGDNNDNSTRPGHEDTAADGEQSTLRDVTRIAAREARVHMRKLRRKWLRDTGCGDMTTYCADTASHSATNDSDVSSLHHGDDDDDDDDDDDWDLPCTLPNMVWTRMTGPEVTRANVYAPRHVRAQQLSFTQDQTLATADGVRLAYRHASAGSIASDGEPVSRLTWVYTRIATADDDSITPAHMVQGKWRVVAQVPSARMPITAITIECDAVGRISGWATLFQQQTQQQHRGSTGQAPTANTALPPSTHAGSEQHGNGGGGGGGGNAQHQHLGVSSRERLLVCRGRRVGDLLLLLLEHTYTNAAVAGLALRFHPEGYLQGTFTRGSMMEPLLLRAAKSMTLCETVLGSPFAFGAKMWRAILAAEMAKAPTSPLEDVGATGDRERGDANVALSQPHQRQVGQRQQADQGQHIDQKSAETGATSLQPAWPQQLANALLLVHVLLQRSEMHPILTYVRTWLSRRPLAPSNFAQFLLRSPAPSTATKNGNATAATAADGTPALNWADALLPPVSAAQENDDAIYRESPNDRGGGGSRSNSHGDDTSLAVVCSLDQVPTLLACTHGDLDEVIAVAATACPWLLASLLTNPSADVQLAVAEAMCGVALALPRVASAHLDRSAAAPSSSQAQQTNWPSFSASTEPQANSAGHHRIEAQIALPILSVSAFASSSSWLSSQQMPAAGTPRGPPAPTATTATTAQLSSALPASPEVACARVTRETRPCRDWTEGLRRAHDTVRATYSQLVRFGGQTPLLAAAAATATQLLQHVLLGLPFPAALRVPANASRRRLTFEDAALSSWIRFALHAGDGPLDGGTSGPQDWAMHSPYSHEGAMGVSEHTASNGSADGAGTEPLVALAAAAHDIITCTLLALLEPDPQVQLTPQVAATPRVPSAFLSSTRVAAAARNAPAATPPLTWDDDDRMTLSFAASAVRDQASGAWVVRPHCMAPSRAHAIAFVQMLRPALCDVAEWLASGLNVLERYLDAGRHVDARAREFSHLVRGHAAGSRAGAATAGAAGAAGAAAFAGGDGGGTDGIAAGDVSRHMDGISRVVPAGWRGCGGASSTSLLSVARTGRSRGCSLPSVSVHAYASHGCVLDMLMALACMHALHPALLREALLLPSPSLNRPDALTANHGGGRQASASIGGRERQPSSLPAGPASARQASAWQLTQDPYLALPLADTIPVASSPQRLSSGGFDALFRVHSSAEPSFALSARMLLTPEAYSRVAEHCPNALLTIANGQYAHLRSRGHHHLAAAARLSTRTASLLAALRREQRYLQPLHVDRTRVLSQTMHALRGVGRTGAVEVRFQGEEGAGDGVLRAWAGLVSRLLVEPVSLTSLASPISTSSVHLACLAYRNLFHTTPSGSFHVPNWGHGAHRTSAVAGPALAVLLGGTGEDSFGGSRQEGSARSRANTRAAHRQQQCAGDTPLDEGSDVDGDDVQAALLLRYEDIGRFIGLCIKQRQVITLRLARHVWKLILQRPLRWHDVAFLDRDRYVGLCELLRKAEHGSGDGNDGVGEDEVALYGLTFAYTWATGVSRAHVELVEGGDDTDVSSAVAFEYMRHFTLDVLSACAGACAAMRRGLLSTLDEQVFATMSVEDIWMALNGGGATTVTLEDVLAHMAIVDRRTDSDDIGARPLARFRDMLVECLADMTQGELGEFVCFVTGSPQLLAGNEEGRGDGGAAGARPTLAVHVQNASDRLPQAQNCFSQLFLPFYEEVDVLASKLRLAMQTQEFGLA